MQADLVLGQLNFANHRILIYKSEQSLRGQSPDIVIGSTNFTSSSSATSQTKFLFPRDVFSDGKRIFLSDTGNQRILIWNAIPTVNLAPADVVLGQANFSTSAAATTSTGLRTPRGLFSDGVRLFVADAVNHRVLIWNRIPQANGTPADVVLGQPDFTTMATGLSNRNLNLPLGVNFDGKRLFATDYSNNRVLIWNSLPTANYTPANVVVGQPHFSSNTARTTQSGMNGPAGVFSDGNRLFVSDFDNNRILVWNNIPTTNGESADFVIGQPDFTTSSSGRTNAKLNGPLELAFDGRKLFIAEASNIQVLSFPIIRH